VVSNKGEGKQIAAASGSESQSEETPTKKIGNLKLHQYQISEGERNSDPANNGAAEEDAMETDPGER
jgi:hypothetical protein